MGFFCFRIFLWFCIFDYSWFWWSVLLAFWLFVMVLWLCSTYLCISLMRGCLCPFTLFLLWSPLFVFCLHQAVCRSPGLKCHSFPVFCFCFFGHCSSLFLVPSLTSSPVTCNYHQLRSHLLLVSLFVYIASVSLLLCVLHFFHVAD